MNERVKAVRKKTRLTQREFGKRLGVQDTAISKIESGERNLTDQMILAICREFNVNEDWLRTGAGGEEAMYDEFDDSNIAAVISQHKLDELSQLILKAYVDMDPGKRASFNVFVREMADRVMAENIQAARVGVNNIIGESHAPDSIKIDLVGKVAGVFHESFKDISEPNVDIDNDTISKEDFLEMASDSFDKEKNQESQVFSAKESGAG